MADDHDKTKVTGGRGTVTRGWCRGLIYRLAESGELWKERVAVMTTFYFVKNCCFEDTLALANKFLDHPHQLIHKAVGWILREIGKRDYHTLY